MWAVLVPFTSSHFEFYIDTWSGLKELYNCPEKCSLHNECVIVGGVIKIIRNTRKIITQAYSTMAEQYIPILKQGWQHVNCIPMQSYIDVPLCVQ